MVEEVKTHLASSVSLNLADTANFVDKTVSRTFNLDQVNEESLTNRYQIDGAVADQAIDLGNVNNPTYIFIKVTSKFDGGGATTLDAPAKVTFKIGSGTAFDANFMLFAVNVDAQLGAVTKDIKITTLADSDTTVEVFQIGRKT